jgi:CheY-like chemotaxis protein
MELRTIRVLVVDDTPDSLDMFVEMLAVLGAEARGVRGAEAALQELASFAPQVILSDLEMPVKSGYALLQDLRARGVLLPVIAITGYATAHHNQRAQAAGFAAFLAKPCGLALLRDTILRVLG